MCQRWRMIHLIVHYICHAIFFVRLEGELSDLSTLSQIWPLVEVIIHMRTNFFFKIRTKTSVFVLFGFSVLTLLCHHQDKLFYFPFIFMFFDQNLQIFSFVFTHFMFIIRCRNNSTRSCHWPVKSLVDSSMPCSSFLVAGRKMRPIQKLLLLMEYSSHFIQLL